MGQNYYRIKRSKNNEKVIKLSSKLESLNPVSALSRGYILANKDGKTVSSIHDVQKDDILCLKMKDGEIDVKVI